MADSRTSCVKLLNHVVIKPTKLSAPFTSNQILQLFSDSSKLVSSEIQRPQPLFVVIIHYANSTHAQKKKIKRNLCLTVNEEIGWVCFSLSHSLVQDAKNKQK